MANIPNPNLAWPIPLQAVNMIAESEGLRLKAYKCPAGIPTIGWGHTGPDVIMGETVWTKEDADNALLRDIKDKVREVNAVCTNTPTEYQLGALVSFAYNCGGWQKSTVIKQHNAGNWQAASRAFGMWNKARVNGKLTELPGLTTRRALESAMYLRPSADEPAHKIPQAVEPENTIVESKTVKSGVVAVGAGAIGAISEIGNSIGGLEGPIKGAKTVLTDYLGIPPAWFPYLVLIMVGIAVIYYRNKNKSEGWV